MSLELVEKSLLSDEQKEKVRKLVRSNRFTYLSPEREVAPFMLFMTGNSLEAISKLSDLPLDVIYSTAVQYQWAEKRAVLNESGENPLTMMQKKIAEMMLVATFLNAQKELAKLISSDDNGKSPLVVRNLSGLQALMDMITKLNGSPEPGQINAQNVQINNYNSPALTPEQVEEK